MTSLIKEKDYSLSCSSFFFLLLLLIFVCRGSFVPIKTFTICYSDTLFILFLFFLCLVRQMFTMNDDHKNVHHLNDVTISVNYNRTVCIMKITMFLREKGIMNQKRSEPKKNNIFRRKKERKESSCSFISMSTSFQCNKFYCMTQKRIAFPLFFLMREMEKR